MNISISVKLPLTIVALCSIAVGTMGYLAYGSAYSILEEEGRARLTSAVQALDDSVSGKLDALRVAVVTQSISPVTRVATTGFIGAFEAIPGDKTEYLQNRYITENEHPVGQKQLLDFTTGRDPYNRVHRKYHAYYRSVVELNGFADLYLLGLEGNVLFSVMKTDDYAVDVRADVNVNTGLSRAFERVIAAGNTVDFTFEDFAPYQPVGDTYSAFLGTPVLASNGAVIGVFIARIDAGVLALGGTDTQSMDQSGSTWVVGSDMLVRRSTGNQTGTPYPESTSDVQAEVTQEDPVRRAFQGLTGVMTSGSTLAAYEPFEFYGARWAVVAQQDIEELFASATQLQRTILFEGGTLVAIATLIAVFLARNIILPLTAVGSAMRHVEQGDLDSPILEVTRHDEIGGIAKTLDSLRISLLSAKSVEERASMLGTALEATSACLMIVNSDLQVQHANAAIIDLLTQLGDVGPQWDTDNIVGCSLGDALPDANLLRDSLSGDTQQVSRFDVRFGAARVTLEVQPVLDADGMRNGAVIEWKDKTQEFRQSALINSIDQQQCLVEFDLNGAVTSANANFQTAYGANADQIIGTSIDTLIAAKPDDQSHQDGFLSELLKTRSIWGQFRIQTEQDLWIDGGFTVIADGAGAPVSIAFIGNDISRAHTALEVADAQRAKAEAVQQEVVTALGSALSRLSQGDLTAQIQTPFQEEYEPLRRDFNAAVSVLEELIRSISSSGENIYNNAGEISEAADNLSHRTEESASTLEEISSALEELTKAVKTASAGASEADVIVRNAKESAEKSGEVVGETVTAMGEIEKSSREISKIVNVIDDIAFQTNLLALNAGVEAARAGDAGRGFAVVATEVRSLAQRSADAAKEISALISQSGQQVDRGVSLVDETGTALQNIVGAVSDISKHVSEIARSAEEQASGVTEINAAIVQLDQVTQQNTAMFEETTAATHSLKDEASELSQMMAKFRVGDAAQEALAIGDEDEGEFTQGDDFNQNVA